LWFLPIFAKTFDKLRRMGLFPSWLDRLTTSFSQHLQVN
jgi:hypothetical protein